MTRTERAHRPLGVARPRCARAWALLAPLPCLALGLAACSGPPFDLSASQGDGGSLERRGAVSADGGGGLEDVPPVPRPDVVLEASSSTDSGDGGAEGSVLDVWLADALPDVRQDAPGDAPVTSPEASAEASAPEAGPLGNPRVCCKWGAGGPTTVCLPPSETPRPELGMTSFGCWSGVQGSSARTDDCGQCAYGLRCAPNFGSVGNASSESYVVPCPTEGGP
jgi:hypothetical protein